MQDRRWSRTAIYTYGAMIFGVLIGCFLFGVIYIYDDISAFRLHIEGCDVSVLKGISGQELLFVLLKKRMIQILIFILLIFLSSYYITSFCFCCGIGIYYGFLVCDLIIQFGLSGLCYGIVCFFPHYLFYFLGIYLLGTIYDECRFYRYNVNKKKLFVKIFVIISVVSMSFFWEVHFQKIFLENFFNI